MQQSALVTEKMVARVTNGDKIRLVVGDRRKNGRERVTNGVEIRLVRCQQRTEEEVVEND